jgi:hypothetical protein
VPILFIFVLALGIKCRALHLHNLARKKYSRIFVLFFSAISIVSGSVSDSSTTKQVLFEQMKENIGEYLYDLRMEGHLKKKKKKHKTAGCGWFIPIILATQEAEIRRLLAPSQPRQIVPQDPISKNPSQK